MRYLLPIAALGLVACTSYSTTLKHPETGDTVTCEASGAPANSPSLTKRVESCVQDYQARGYQRVED